MTTDELLAAFEKNPSDFSLVPALAGRPDARVIPALSSAFETVEEKMTRQIIAIQLIHLDPYHDAYFKYLADFAEKAVESDAPPVLLTDIPGEAKPRKNPAFEAWCLEKKIAFEVCAKEQMHTFLLDLNFLGLSGDHLGVEIFKRGLASRNPMVLVTCSNILARLKEESAVPLIIRRLAGLRETERKALAMTLADFESPDAVRVFQQFYPHAASRGGTHSLFGP